MTGLSSIGGEPTAWDLHVQRRLETLKSRGLLRTLLPSDNRPGAQVICEGRTMINFSSNDYLGLSHSPVLARASAAALERGAGSTASRLMAGDDPHHHRLEEKLAVFNNTQAAVVLGSGYLANVGAIAALAGRNDAVFSDRANHASIIDGIRVGGARLYRYPHNDTAALEAMLRSEPHRRKLIVTETVFGMDGDVAHLAGLVKLKQQYGAALFVDEAHGGGVFGPGGRGYAAEIGVSQSIDLHMGTFGKAFGVYGAYLAGRKPWIDLIASTCRTFIYTTALPPAAIAAVDASVDLVKDADQRRRKVFENAERFRRGARELGLNTGASCTQIVPVILGSAQAAMAAGARLREAGVLTVPVRPPTVPQGAARLRFSLTAAHCDGQIDEALKALDAAVATGRPARRVS